MDDLSYSKVEWKTFVIIRELITTAFTINENLKIIILKFAFLVTFIEFWYLGTIFLKTRGLIDREKEKPGSGNR